MDFIVDFLSINSSHLFGNQDEQSMGIISENVCTSGRSGLVAFQVEGPGMMSSGAHMDMGMDMMVMVVVVVMMWINQQRNN